MFPAIIHVKFRMLDEGKGWKREGRYHPSGSRESKCRISVSWGRREAIAHENVCYQISSELILSFLPRRVRVMWKASVAGCLLERDVLVFFPRHGEWRAQPF